jgi:hypothetical protein
MRIRTLAGGATILLVCWLAAPAPAQHSPGAHAREESDSPAAFAAGMHAAMATMAKEVDALPMTGDPDRDFLAMMIPHHEAAVEMARLILVHGRDPLVRRLAEEILATQQAEISTMTHRLHTLHASPDPDPGGFPALGGTRGSGGSVNP